VRDWPGLSASLLVTLKITVLALLIAASLGLVLAVVFAQSPLLELSLFPYAVILQVTPIVAIAPLIIIWVDNIQVALLICAWIVAFFPILSNTTVGLNSTDRNLVDLFRLYGASPWQVLWRLRLPTAMPYFLAGLRISGGLSLIGAIVAEFVGAQAGLGVLIQSMNFSMDVAGQFSVLFILSLIGLFLNTLVGLVRRRVVFWDQGERKP
jgi:NitT/TauT family transport system permease protein